MSATPCANPADTQQSISLSRKRPLGTDGPVSHHLNTTLASMSADQAIYNGTPADVMDEDARAVDKS